MEKKKLQNKAEKATLSNKAVQDIIEDAKDGVLKDKNKKKAQELSEALKSSEKPSKGHSWVFDGIEHADLDELAAKHFLTKDEVASYINKGRINRKG